MKIIIENYDMMIAPTVFWQNNFDLICHYEKKFDKLRRIKWQ